MKRILLFAALAVVAVTANAQHITGKVIDASSQQPLSGATISIGGKSVATTNANGTFSFDCTATVTISISFVGYESQQQQVNCNASIQVALQLSNNVMENVELTATSTQNKSLLYQPVSISKLSSTELNRGDGLFLDDAINANVPGVTMNRRAVSSGQQFNIRGYGNGSRGTRGISSNFDGQGYKVYLNGIPITNAEGITVLDDIDFGSVGNVEVVKGPAGTLYGLAIAGVVNLETMKPPKGTSIGQDVLMGNYGLQRYTTHFQYATDNTSLLINYGHQKSDGFTIHNASRKDFVNIIGRFQPNAKQSILSYFGYSNSYDERSGELSPDQYANNDFSGNIRYIRNNAHSKVKSVRAGLGHTYTFSNHVANSTTVYVTSIASDNSSAFGWSDGPYTDFGLRSTFDTKFDLKNNTSLSGITGVETQRKDAQSIGYSMMKDPRDPNPTWQYGNPYYYVINATRSNIVTTSATTSLFTEWTLSLPKDFSITGGIGFSNMKLALDDRMGDPNGTTHYATTYGNMWSPHLAINKVIQQDVSVYLAYSKGFKSPVSSYFYIPYSSSNSASGIINTNLMPEKGNQFELGSKGVILNNRLQYQLALFRTVFSDKMTTVAVPNPDNSAVLYSYIVNGGKQNNNGVEFSAKYKTIHTNSGFFTAVDPFVNFTYSDFKYEDYQFETGSTPGNKKVVDYSGSQVAGVSKVVASYGVDITTQPGLYANFVHLYRDKMPIVSPDTLFATSYNLLNGKIGYRKRVSTHFDLDISFGVNNITGTKYPIMIFVNQLPDAYIAGPRKANYFATLKLNYIF